MTTTKQMQEESEAVRGLTVGQVMSVYSGRDGACCCGCAGKHSYASQYRDVAGTNRGYEVTDDEVSDAAVARVLGLIQKSADEAEFDGDMATLVQGKRLYVVYLLPRQYRETQAGQKLTAEVAS